MQLINAKDTVSIIGIETVNGSAGVKLKPQSSTGILYVADDAEHPIRCGSTAPPAARAPSPSPIGAPT